MCLGLTYLVPMFRTRMRLPRLRTGGRYEDAHVPCCPPTSQFPVTAGCQQTQLCLSQRREQISECIVQFLFIVYRKVLNLLVLILYTFEHSTCHPNGAVTIRIPPASLRSQRPQAGEPPGVVRVFDSVSWRQGGAHSLSASSCIWCTGTRSTTPSEKL